MPRFDGRRSWPRPSWRRFEDYGPTTGADGLDAPIARDIRHAFMQHAEADREIAETLFAVARAEALVGRQWARCLARRVRRRGSATATSRA